MRQRIEFESPHLLHALFANDLGELDYISKQLGVSVVTREGWLLLEGADKEVKQARLAFEDLEKAYRAGLKIGTREFRAAVDHAKSGENGIAGLASIRLLDGRKGRNVVARSVKQLEYIKRMQEDDLVFSVGPAGTGKTYLAMAMALTELLAQRVSRIILTRPAVESGEELGFLPGDFREKVAPYLRPLYDAIYDMLHEDEAQKYFEQGVIEIAPLAYMRGRTLSKSFVILDEAQNATCEQMLMFLTRIGEGSRCVVTGDPSQVDLHPKLPSGLHEAQKVLDGTEGISFVQLSARDVVRHPLVAKIIKAYEDYRKP